MFPEERAFLVGEVDLEIGFIEVIEVVEAERGQNTRAEVLN